MFQDAEYRRIDEVSISDVDNDRKARWFWISTLLIFFLNTVVILSEVGFFIDEALNRDLNGYNFLPLVVSLLGQAALANGLFGKVHRGVSLLVYIICFEIVPGFIFLIFLLVIFFDYHTMKESIQKYLDKHQWDIHATTLMMWVILLATFLTVYHFIAGWIVYRYRKIRRRSDSNF